MRAALEFEASGDLSGTSAAEAGADRVADSSEIGRADVHVRIAEAGVVEHVGARAFEPHVQAFRHAGRLCSGDC